MKPAIVLLHSSMSSKAQWATLSTQLADKYRCIPLDLLGYGAAPFPAGAGPDYVHTLAHEAEAINAALATELAPGEPFHLVGHSYGGASALHLARQAPERVLSLALHEPVAFHLLPAHDASKLEITGVVDTCLLYTSPSPRDS